MPQESPDRNADLTLDPMLHVAVEMAISALLLGGPVDKYVPCCCCWLSLTACSRMVVRPARRLVFNVGVGHPRGDGERQGVPPPGSLVEQAAWLYLRAEANALAPAVWAWRLRLYNAPGGVRWPERILRYVFVCCFVLYSHLFQVLRAEGGAPAGISTRP